jgi:uncharacterized membrane protein
VLEKNKYQTRRGESETGRADAHESRALITTPHSLHQSSPARGHGTDFGMKKHAAFVLKRSAAGLLVIAPIYLAGFLLLKVANTLIGLVRPFAKMLPEWMPGARILSLLMVLILCFVVGLAVSTSMGRSTWKRMEHSLFQKIPGYALFRSLTQQVAGSAQETAWKPALVEIEEALVPAFIIEKLKDGSFTVFVPSIPTPLAGAVYILTANRVHPINVPFTQVLKAVSQWGSGCGKLVAAMPDSRQAASTHDEHVTNYN